MGRDSIEGLGANSLTLEHREKAMVQKGNYYLKEINPLQNGRGPVGMLTGIGGVAKLLFMFPLHHDSAGWSKI